MAYKTKFSIRNPSKYIGDSSNIICRSLWERRVCRYMDENKNILRWGSEEIKIPYYSPIDKKMHNYYPDFIAEIKKPCGIVQTYIIEVKPKRQTKAPIKKRQKKKTFMQECLTYTINQKKWDAAEKVCNKKGWNFLILTEDTILP